MERTEYRMGPPMEPVITPPSQQHRGREMRRRGMRPSFWFSAFLFGAAVGGALGLLFAPRKGREIREALAENLGTQGVSGEFQKNVSKALSTGRTTPSALVNQAQRELDEMRSQAINTIQDARLRGKIAQKQAEVRYLQGRERLHRART